MDNCDLRPAVVAQLARGIEGGVLHALHVCRCADGSELFDAQNVLLLGDAFRTSTSLTTLDLIEVRLWSHVELGFALLESVQHSSITDLDLSKNRVRCSDQAAVGLALATWWVLLSKCATCAWTFARLAMMGLAACLTRWLLPSTCVHSTRLETKSPPHALGAGSFPPFDRTSR